MRGCPRVDILKQVRICHEESSVHSSEPPFHSLFTLDCLAQNRTNYTNIKTRKLHLRHPPCVPWDRTSSVNKYREKYVMKRCLFTV